MTAQSEPDNHKTAGNPNMTTVATPLAPAAAPSPATSMPTNTLIITGLSRAHFLSEPFMAELKKALREDTVLTWAPLKSMSRIICVFSSESACQRAKKYIKAAAEASYVDEEFLNYATLKAYYAPNTDMSAVQSQLQLPDPGKLFFISPPPSPPVGWTSRMEDEPNPAAFDANFYSNLHQSLADAAEPQQQSPQPEQAAVVPEFKPSGLTRRITLHEPLKLDTNQGISSAANSSPTIILECDDDESPVSPGVTLLRTERPPVEL